MVGGGGRGRYPAASRNYFHAAVESWMERRTVLYSNLTKARHIPPSTVESDATAFLLCYEMVTVGPPSPSRVDSRLPPTISKHEFPLPLLGLLPKFYVNRCRRQSLVQISKCSLKNEVNPVPRIAEHCNIFILDLHLQSQRSTSTWETVAVDCHHPALSCTHKSRPLCVSGETDVLRADAADGNLEEAF